MVLEAILFMSLFHHKKPTKEWADQRAYLDRAVLGIKAYEADVRYSKLERPQLDAFEVQFQLAWDEKDSDPKKFIQDMKHLDELGQVLDSVDQELHRENAI